MALWAIIIAAYVMLTPNRFEAETVLLVRNGRADMVLSPDERAQSRGDQKESQIATEMELLSQQDLLRKVVQRTGATGSGTDIDEAVKNLRKNLEITPVFKADLIRIKYVARQREDATKVLSTLLSCYMDRHLEIHHSSDAYPFFDQQVAKSQQELKGAADKLASFEQTSGIVLLNDQKEVSVRSLADLEVAYRNSTSAYDEARRQVEVLTQRRAGLQSRITTQSRRMPNQYSVERMNTMLTELQNKRMELMTKFHPDNRLVQEVDQQIANVQSSLTQAQSMTSTEEATDVNPLYQAVERDLAAAEINAETARVRHVVLTRQIQQQHRETAQLGGSTTEHENLVREVKRLEENYKLYSAKREEARISDAMDKQKIANVVIAEAPVVPHLPKSKFSGGLAGVFLLGCAVILSTTLAISGRRQTFETPWELEAFTGMPVLATLAHSTELTGDRLPRLKTATARDLALTGGD